LPRTGNEFWPIVAIFLVFWYYLFIIKIKGKEKQNE